MPWHSTWPLGTASVKANRPTGADNTTYIETTMKVDHYFNQSAPNDGKHKQVRMPELTSAPATGGNIGALYTKESGSAGLFTNLFWRQESGGASPNRNQGAEIQLTGIKPSATTEGWTFLAGGLHMQWGTVAQVNAITNTVTLPLGAFDGGFLNVQFTTFRDDNTSPGSSYQFYVDKSTVTSVGTTFNIINRSGHAYGYYWVAIGIRN